MRGAFVLGLVISAFTFGCAAAPPPRSAAPPQPAEPTVAIPSEKKAVDEKVDQKDEQAKDGALAAEPHELEKRMTRGPMWGDEVGEAFGTGGLGLTGIGEGGGGQGAAIGLSKYGALGHGAGTGTGQGFGGGAGRFGGSGSGARARVSAATATTTGSGLSADVIRHIVRRHLTQIRYCYAKAMAKDPTIGGKIAVKFTIDARGAVPAAAATDTTIADQEMVSCVVAVVRKLSFPQPENGGVMTVTYPFHFAPGDP